jgi:hypothetical protein
MTAPADEYRKLAAEMSARARAESNPQLRIEYNTLALGYELLVQQAERNKRTDVVYETPPARPPEQQQPIQQQQQQQEQPEEKPEPET